MAGLRHGAGGGTLIGAAVGYIAARSLDPRYDQGAVLPGVAAACRLAFGPEVHSTLRMRSIPCGLATIPAGLMEGALPIPYGYAGRSSTR